MDTFSYYIVLVAKPLLKDLFNIVTPDYGVYWRKIGESLGIRQGILNAIGVDNHHKAEDCCNAMWEEWLNIDTRAAWCKVIQIIDNDDLTMNMDDVMHDIILNSSDQLQQFYSNERYKSKEDDWPPFQPDHFTGVALIHHKEKHTTLREKFVVAKEMYTGTLTSQNATLKRDAGASAKNTPKITTLKEDTRKVDSSTNVIKQGRRESKNITELFSPARKSNLYQEGDNVSQIILIEGAPGIGKTILSKEIAYQWANKIILVDKYLLFLVFLRDPFLHNVKSLKDFVSYAMCTSQQNKNIEIITECLENTLGKDITIVLDGYDEMSKELRSNSFITDIINRRILRLCGLVITSRPTASTDLHGICDCRIEILGFTKEDRKQYIHQSLESNDKIRQLEKYLEMNRFIDSLCYIPLNMTILICLFKEFSESSGSILPKNQTDMNDQFICITISRFLRKKKIQLNVKCLEDLPAPYKQQFKNLSRIAFHLLGKEKVVFNDDDIKQYSEWSDLGLLNVVKYSDYIKDIPSMSYNFLHFSLQEFLAAYHVASLSFFSQVAVLKSTFWNSIYLNSWVMYAGLTKSNLFALKHLLTGRKFLLHSLIIRPNSIANEIIGDKVKCLHLFQCFLEAGDDRMCEQVGNSLLDKDINLSNTALLPKDMHTLCFFLIRSTTKQWKKFDLSNCYIGDDGCDTLANLLLGDDNTNMHINVLNLSSNQLTSRSIPKILKFVQYFNTKELIVNGNVFDSEMFFNAIFMNVIQHNSFFETSLSIETNKDSLSVYAINCKNLFATQIRDFICSTNTTYNIYLWNTNFILDDLVVLLSKENIHSIRLNVYKEDSNSRILNIQAKFQKYVDLVRQENYGSQSPSFIFNDISYILFSDVQMFAFNVVHSHVIEVLKHICKPSLLILNLTGCMLSNEVFYTIGNILSTDFELLKFINLSECNLRDMQCEHFCKVLFSSKSRVTHLNEFNLSHNQLTNACISTIIESLKFCVFERINISYNQIEVNRFRCIFKSFYQDFTLLNSSLKIPLLVINITSLQDERISTLNFNYYVEAYVANYTCTDNSDLFDSLLTSANNNFLHRVVFFDCSSLLTNKIDKISLLLENKVKVEIQETKIADLIAAEFLTWLKSVSINYKNIQYTLISKDSLFVHNQNYEELKVLLPCDNSKVIFQFKDSHVLATAIPEILTNINFFKKVQLVDLSGCKIGDSGCEIFCNSFESCIAESVDSQAYLYELNLSNNCLTSLSTVYITRLLQLCTINKLMLFCNEIETENFSTIFFKTRYDTYSNFRSKVPLIVINNDVSTELTNNLGRHCLHFTIYFLSTPLNEDLASILNMIGNGEHHGWIFLINTNIPMDCFDKIVQSLLANGKMIITVIEEDLKDDVADSMMTQLKMLQAIRHHENRDSESIQYLLLSNNYCLANNIDHVVVAEILNFSELQDFVNHYFFFSPSFPFNTCSNQQWELIDLSNCTIGDYGFTILLDYFTPPEYTNTVNFLNLTNNELSSDSTKVIAKLVVYAKLQTLFVSHNDVKENDIADAVCKLQSISSEPCVPVIRIFKNHCVALVIHNLIISSVQKLIDCKSCNVTYLSLTNCYLNDQEYTHVDLLSLKKLDLSQKILQELEIEYDIDVEEENKLTHFIIRNSNVTDISSDILASKLIKNNKIKLTRLEISQCKLQQAGLLSIINALEETSSLLDINLNSNFITNPVVNKLANVFASNSQLCSLNLSKCNLQEDGLNDILKVLNKSLLLKTINFSYVKYQCFVNHCNDLQKSLDFQRSTCSFNLLPLVIRNTQSLAYINISNCNITENDLANILVNISLLESIKHLDVSSNTVTDIVAGYVAHAIRNNRDMEFLNVSNCCLSEHGLFTIFNALSDLSSLLHIDVSLNRVSNTAAEEITNVFSLNRKLAHLNLHQCNLDSNDFVQIMSSVRKNGFITHLDISHNCINLHTASIISTIILNNPLLKYLNISFCNLTEDVIEIFANCLKKLPNLKHFDISHNNMTYSSAETIALAIADNESLEYLDLSECGLIDFRVALLSLQRHSKLKCLMLRSNIIFQNKIFVQDTDPADVISNSCMQCLDLSKCELSELQMKTVARQLLHVSAIKCLNMSYNRLSDDAAIDIASAISRNPFFENINLSSCELSESQITTVVKALKSLSRLKHLDISHNKAADKAANELATALTTNPLLENLNLSNCDLSQSHSAGIVKALSKKESFLKFLDISHNTVTNDASNEIASVVICNPLLEHLNLAHCELSELQLIGIFKALSKTSLLTLLDISHNKVTKEATNEIAAVSVNNKSLKHLNLSACNLVEDSMKLVADSLSHVTSLVSLDVSFNCITEKAAYSMADALKRNIALEQLNFCTCFVGNAAMIICDAINQHSSLTHLNMSLNVTDNNVAKCLARVLNNNTDIVHLDFGQCCLLESGFVKLLDGLANVTTLQYLNLEGNNISKALTSKIASLVSNNSTLKHINLCNCNLPKVEGQNIVQAIGKLHLVEYLNMSGNEISNWTCIYLKEALSNNDKIRYLDFSRCKIQGKGTYNILISLKPFSCLKSLNFTSCYFNDTSASELLPKVITQNKSLQHLNLTDCNLQGEGLIAIAKALQVIAMVKHLSLNSNHITNVASLEVASALNKNSKLQFLALSDCGLQETGLINISESLCKISSLRHLDLSHNGITDKAATVIASAIANNPTIQYLDFTFCTWQETGITIIQQVINTLPMIKEVDFRLRTSNQ